MFRNELTLSNIKIKVFSVLGVRLVAVIVFVSSGNTTPPPNYPVDAFDEVAACIQVPGCIKPEDRVEGDIALAPELTYRNPICLDDAPCIVVCDTHACWCEADETCN